MVCFIPPKIPKKILAKYVCELRYFVSLSARNPTKIHIFERPPSVEVAEKRRRLYRDGEFQAGNVCFWRHQPWHLATQNGGKYLDICK